MTRYEGRVQRCILNRAYCYGDAGVQKSCDFQKLGEMTIPSCEKCARLCRKNQCFVPGLVHLDCLPLSASNNNVSYVVHHGLRCVCTQTARIKSKTRKYWHSVSCSLRGRSCKAMCLHKIGKETERIEIICDQLYAVYGLVLGHTWEKGN